MGVSVCTVPGSQRGAEFLAKKNTQITAGIVQRRLKDIRCFTKGQLWSLEFVLLALQIILQGFWNVFCK